MFGRKQGLSEKQLDLGQWLIERTVFGREYEHERVDLGDPRITMLCEVVDEFGTSNPRQRYWAAMEMYYVLGKGTAEIAVVFKTKSHVTETRRLRRARELLFSTVRGCL